MISEGLGLSEFRESDFIWKLKHVVTLQCIVLSFHRNKQEEDLRENHPFFDTPLFTVERESRSEYTEVKSKLAQE